MYPEELASTGWLELVGGVIHAPKAATCHDRIFDFFVVSADLSHAVVCTRLVGDTQCVPHSAVRLWFESGARQDMVR